MKDDNKYKILYEGKAIVILGNKSYRQILFRNIHTAYDTHIDVWNKMKEDFKVMLKNDLLKNPEIKTSGWLHNGKRIRFKQSDINEFIIWFEFLNMILTLEDTKILFQDFKNILKSN